MMIILTVFAGTLLGALSLPTQAQAEEVASPPIAETHALDGAPSGEQVQIEGVLCEKGTRTPLEGVNVFILPAKIKATTDSKGHFVFNRVASGDFTFVVNLAGYKKLELEDGQTPSRPNESRELYLQKQSYQAYETTVFGREQKRDDTTRTLKQAQFANLPGANGDPIKAVQNLPGVNRSAPLSAQVIIQGSAPQDTRYMIDGHEVPLIFHFGGLSSVVEPEALDRVEYLSAGYGPEHGRAIGGLVGVWTKEPRTDRLAGFGFVDLFNAGGLIEGPTGKKSSFLLGFRQSYIGAVFKAIAKKDADFNLTVAPEFSDLVGIFQTEVTPIDQFKLVAVGSKDSLGFVLAQPVDRDPAFRGTFESETDFFRIIPEWTHKHSSITTSRWSLGIGRDWIKFLTDTNYFRLASTTLTARGELERKMSDTWTAQWGWDNRYSWATVNILLPTFYFGGGVANPFSIGQEQQADIRSHYDQIGLYWRNEIQIADTPWIVLPSLRGEYYSQTRELFPLLPRLAARYKVDDSLFYRVSGGLYVEPPTEQQSDSVFGNPDVKSPRAWHLAVGGEKDFREGSSRGWILAPGLFYKYFDRLVDISNQQIVRDGTLKPENFNNSLKGTAYGAEVLLRGEFAPFTGWLSYTLSRSTRYQPGQSSYLFTYDQTHLLTAIASMETGNNVKVSTRFRLATGNPTTPVIGGVYDSDNDVYLPVRGGFYTNRLEAFYQLDLRIDKRWIMNKWILAAYLDLQNLTNHKNLETVQYSYNYKSQTKISGLPLLPTFGLKAEF